MFSQILFAVFCSALSVQSTPTPVTISTRQSITALSASQIATYKPYTYYSGTAYCLPNETVTWTCGGEDFMICLQDRLCDTEWQ